MTPEAYKKIVARLEKWSSLGAKTVPNGTRLIGHVPHVGAEAYLHQIYPGLSDKCIKELESTVGRELPNPLRSYLQHGNGIALFLECTLYGLRQNFVRDPDSSRQPFHMKTANVDERPRGADPSAVFIGGYSYDGSKLFMVPGDSRVFHCPRREGGPIYNTWPDLSTFLSLEISRLETLFDASGKLIDANAPTMPALGTYK